MKNEKKIWQWGDDYEPENMEEYPKKLSRGQCENKYIIKTILLAFQQEINIRK